ncbi:MAG: aspartate-semialdehyde dehydrogenase, partial [Pseudomonadota bacterium]
MSSSYNVAVVGATGAVGEVMLKLLAERGFPAQTVHAVASARSAGETVEFDGRALRIQALDAFDFSGVDFAFFSAGGSISAEFAPIAAAAGSVVIDNTSHFRMQPDVPLIVPEVNGDLLDGWWQRDTDNGKKGGIIANPNCSTIQMLLAIAPIHRSIGIKRVQVATYQAVSGAGRSALEELGRQTAARLSFREAEASVFNAPIAFNVIPRIDCMEDNGFTREEMKMHYETRRILDDESISVNATAVRVPVFYGHAEAVHLELNAPMTSKAARELLRSADGVSLIEGDSDPMPLTDASGHDEVFVGRIRQDHSNDHGLNLWVVSDNLRKGAALNAIQIGETLIARHHPQIQTMIIGMILADAANKHFIMTRGI